MKFYLIEKESLVYIDTHKHNKPIDIEYSIWDKDELDPAINFESSQFLLRAYAGAGKKQWQFIQSIKFLTGFCVNDEVKQLLSDFTLTTHEYHIMPCEFRGESLTYWWFRLHAQPLQHLIDVSRCVFYNNYNEPENLFKAPFDAYLKETYPMQAIMRGLDCWVKEIYVSKEIAQYDFFSLSHFPAVCLVSERLKEAMDKRKFKGVKFTEATWLKLF